MTLLDSQNVMGARLVQGFRVISEQSEVLFSMFIEIGLPNGDVLALPFETPQFFL